MTTITIPGVPVAQPRQRMAKIGGFLRSYTPASDPVNTFKAAVQLAWSDKIDAPPMVGPLRLTVQFVLPRPDYLNTKKCRGGRRWYSRKPDLDNCLKSVKDALNKMAWRDDSQVCQVYASKQYAGSDEQPHTVLTVEPITED